MNPLEPKSLTFKIWSKFGAAVGRDATEVGVDKLTFSASTASVGDFDWSEPLDWGRGVGIQA